MMLPRIFDQIISQAHTQHSYNGFTLSVEAFRFQCTFRKCVEHRGQIQLIVPPSSPPLSVSAPRHRYNRRSPRTDSLSVFPDDTVRPLILLGIHVSALIDAFRYGISMIHIIRGRTGPGWTGGTRGFQGGSGTPWHPLNARLVLFTSLLCGSNSFFQSKESRESLLSACDARRTAAAGG